MNRNLQRGFGAIVAIVVLVILGALAAAMLKFGTVQQLSSAQDVLSARAWVAAKAGTEWGLFKALQPTGSVWCDADTTQTLDLTGATGFRVTVTCRSREYTEGESSPGMAKKMRVYKIDAVACNAAVSCPNDAVATSLGYVERRRQVIATN